MYIAIGVIVGIISVILSAILSVRFSSIAKEKGNEGNGWFWLCFFLGIAGYVYVSALPDKVLIEEVKQTNTHLNALESQIAELRLISKNNDVKNESDSSDKTLKENKHSTNPDLKFYFN